MGERRLASPYRVAAGQEMRLVHEPGVRDRNPAGPLAAVERLIGEVRLRHEEVRVAGTPNAVFRLAPADLVAMTGGDVVAIA
jgi:hypothetical protein